jgi:superfamily II DNA or RNA helicase
MAGERRLCVLLPTGTGKSVLLAAFADLRQAAGRILVLCHRRDVARQLQRTLQQAGVTTSVLMQGQRTGIAAPVVVATIQSLTAETTRTLVAASPLPISTLLIDEAHHAVPGSAYARILDDLEQAQQAVPLVAVGFTATPYRSDQRSMFALLPTCAFAREIPDMIKDGYLAPLTWKAVAVDLDLGTLPAAVRSGEADYAPDRLARALLDETLTERIVQEIAALIEARPTLVFAASVAHAESLAAALRQVGVRAVAVSGRMRQHERQRCYRDWQQGRIQVLCNCSLLTEGFDFPALAALVIARPTRSLILYLQMLGRGMRVAEGKTDCLVIDIIGNHPEESQQVLLPHVVGQVTWEARHRQTPRTSGNRTEEPPTAAWLQTVLRSDGPAGLALLDPIGRSSYRWIAYRNGYVVQLSARAIAILDRDPEGSGLYRSRLATHAAEQSFVQRWIEPTNLPLRQQVALVQEATSALVQGTLGSKDAEWLEHPATEHQLVTLARYHGSLARHAREHHWTKGAVSARITLYEWKPVLISPPEISVVRDTDQGKPEPTE